MFHLGKPSYFITRAWRGMSQWRTSWLSRELIALPAFMFLVLLYGLVHYLGWTSPWFVIKGQIPVDASLLIGILGVIMSVILFVSTAMIYASLRFLQEWHSPLTVANFIFFGLASGFTMAAAFTAWAGIDLVAFYGTWAVIFTVISAITRAFSMLRNKNQAQVDHDDGSGYPPYEDHPALHGIHGWFVQHPGILPWSL
jgi:DMSO reductase anchor subunit